MKSIALISLFLAINFGKSSGQTNPMVRNQRPQPITQNEAVVMTDRLTSSLESRVLNIVRRENGAITQHLTKLDQAVASLKNDIASVHSLSEVIRDLSLRDPAVDDKVEDKFERVDALLNTIRGSLHKLERDLRKNQRTSQQHLPLLIGKPNDYDNNVACSANDPNPLTGVRKIRRNFYAFCDMSNSDEADGWIVIQNRFSGEIDFLRSWSEYKSGFGNLFGEFWLGLDKIHELTSSTMHELMIVMEDFEGNKKTARYSAFAISDESSAYALNLLGPLIEGDAGDSLKYHAGNKFSTHDNDNDEWADGNCARSHFGGWWYKSCDKSNLNGKYFRTDDSQANSYQGIYWNTFVDGTQKSLKKVQMMIRPIDF